MSYTPTPTEDLPPMSEFPKTESKAEFLYRLSRLKFQAQKDSLVSEIFEKMRFLDKGEGYKKYKEEIENAIDMYRTGSIKILTERIVKKLTENNYAHAVNSSTGEEIQIPVVIDTKFSIENIKGQIPKLLYTIICTKNTNQQEPITISGSQELNTIYKIVESEFEKYLPEFKASQEIKKLTQIKTFLEGAKPSLEDVMQIVSSASYYGITFVSQAIASFFPGIAMQPPAANIGGIPLYSVQRIERAMSDRIVKYRAIGDVFLAHQKGTKDSLRIDGKLFGVSRYLFLLALTSLQWEGESTYKPLDMEALKKAVENANAKGFEDSFTQKAGNYSLNYEYHKTFPIITKTDIMTNMYLQTIEWDQSVEVGIDVINYHLLFRKYEEPTEWVVFGPRYKEKNKEESGIVGALKIPAKNKYIPYYKRIEYWIDLLWKVGQTMGEIYPRTFLGIGDLSVSEVDQEALSSSARYLVSSWNGKFMGLL